MASTSPSPRSMARTRSSYSRAEDTTPCKALSSRMGPCQRVGGLGGLSLPSPKQKKTKYRRKRTRKSKIEIQPLLSTPASSASASSAAMQSSLSSIALVDVICLILSSSMSPAAFMSASASKSGLSSPPSPLSLSSYFPHPHLYAPLATPNLSFSLSHSNHSCPLLPPLLLSISSIMQSKQ